MVRRLTVQGADAWTDTAERVSRLVPEMEELCVAADERKETYTAEIRGADGTFRPARALSKLRAAVRG